MNDQISIMKIKKIPINKENDLPPKNFKFITLNKIEMYSPKASTFKKFAVKKNDNRYKFPAVNTSKTNFSKRANLNGKIEEMNTTSSLNADEIKNEAMIKVNNLINSKLNDNSVNVTSHSRRMDTESSSSDIQDKPRETYHLNMKKQILNVFEHKLLNFDEQFIDDIDRSIIERYKKFSPSDYFNKVSNQIFTKLINSNSENQARLNFKNFHLYEPNRIHFTDYSPHDFEKISLIRNYKNEERREIIGKLNAIKDSQLKSNVNFYEKLPQIEEQVKRTLQRLKKTNENYSRLKKIYFGYN